MLQVRLLSHSLTCSSLFWNCISRKDFIVSGLWSGQGSLGHPFVSTRPVLKVGEAHPPFEPPEASLIAEDILTALILFKEMLPSHPEIYIQEGRPTGGSAGL